MPKYKWPTDPPGRPASHSITWAQHQTNATGTFHNYGQNNQQAWGIELGKLGIKSPGEAPSPPPFDAEAEARRTAATKRRTDLTSDNEVDLQQTGQEYGFKYNPATGSFGGFDPTNPFSQAALLMKSRRERDKGENTSFASSGQLYSGAYGAAKKETGNAYDRGYDTLRRGFQDYVKEYLRRKRDINTVPIEELASL